MYNLDDARDMVAAGDYELVTNSSRRDVKNLNWKSKHISAIFALLDENKHFKKSPKEQETDWGTLDCDQYRILLVELDRDEDYEPTSPDEPPIREARRYELGLECFVKFAIDQENPAVGIVSIHQSR